MKKELLFVLLACASTLVLGSNTEISFTTAVLPGDRAPSHVLAVWIEDNAGKHIASVAVYGIKKRGYLDAWTASSRGIVETDAISGATIHVHKAHTVTWNGRDFRGNEVANGAYVIKIEMTSDGDRPIASLAFDLTDASYEKDYTDETYYKQIKVKYAVTTSAIGDVKGSFTEFKANINRQNGTIDMHFRARLNEHASIKIYDLKGTLVEELFAGTLSTGEHRKVMDLPEDMKTGFYIVELRTPTQRVSQKLIR